MINNPLIVISDLIDFPAIKPEHVVPGMKELIDDAQHLRNKVRGARLYGRRQAAERNHVFLHRAGEFIGKRFARHVALGRAADDFVIDVGDVSHKGDFVARRFKPAADNVKRNERAAVTDMRVVIDRDAADVHFHLSGRQRFKSRLGAGKRGIEFKSHDDNQNLAKNVNFQSI